MADRTIYKEHIGRLDVESEYDGQPIKADEQFNQALAFLWGWISTKEAWKPILCDVDGRMLVSTSPTKSNEANHSKPAPTTTSSTVLTENESRKAYLIQNTGSVDVYLSMDGGDATTDDFKLVPDATLSDDVFYGKITGITASGTGELRVLEYT